MGCDLDAALLAAECAAQACPGVIMPFPGGIAASGSKVGEKSRVPAGVGAIMEIIINGHDLEAISAATQAAIAAAVETPGAGEDLCGEL